MLKNLALAVYYPGNSFIHRLQSRTKLLSLLWIVIWLLVAGYRQWHIAPYIVAVVLACVCTALAQISPLEIVRRTWLLALLLVIGSLFFLFTPPGKKEIALYTIGPFFIAYGLLSQILLISGIVLSLPFLLSLLPVATMCNFWRRDWLKALRTFLFLVALVAFFFFWLASGNPSAQLFTIGPFVITDRITWLLFSSSMMLLMLYIFSLYLTMTTAPVVLIEGLTKLLAPLRRLKFPVDDFALMTLLALRFIPTLVEEVEQLMKAQMARGADMMHGTFGERMQSLAMLFVPLMQGSLRRAADLATALEARGYEVDGQQTFLHETTLAARDYATLSILLFITLGSLLL